MVYLRINGSVLDILKEIERNTGKVIVDEIDKARCLKLAQIEEIAKGLPTEYQEKLAKLIKLEDVVMGVTHMNEMLVLNESEETKKIRERLRLKKEKRELKKITGRTNEPDNSGDKTLVAYEKSVKFAMTYLFALFTSTLGGYFASAIIMFFTIMVETSLYITKSYKSDLITQKSNRVFKKTEDRKFEAYYQNLKRREGQQEGPNLGGIAPKGQRGENGDDKIEQEAYTRSKNQDIKETDVTEEVTSKKDK